MWRPMHARAQNARVLERKNGRQRGTLAGGRGGGGGGTMNKAPGVHTNKELALYTQVAC